MTDKTDKTKDLNVRPYARVNDLKPGDIVSVDDDFDCLDVGVIYKVHSDDHGFLYLNCAEGYHGLDGQMDEEGQVYVGIYKEEIK